MLPLSNFARKEAKERLAEPEVEPFYPQCYLYSVQEIEFEQNKSKLSIALFLCGVSLESSHAAASVLASFRPGFIISGKDHQVISRALGEMK